MDDPEGRRPLADDPQFLDSLSELDRGLTGDVAPTSSSPPQRPVPASPASAPRGRPPRSTVQLRTSSQRRVTLPESITAPFEALTIPEPVPPPLPEPEQKEAEDHSRRPLLELFPRRAETTAPTSQPVAASVAPPARQPHPPSTAPPPQAAPRSLDDTDLGAAAIKPSPSETFYGLHEKPFALSTDPRFFFHSTPHDAVSQRLLTAIRNREGLVVLTGDLGSGKTTLCRVIVEELDRRTLTSLVTDPSLTGDELLRKVLADFGVSRDESARGAAATGRDLMLTLRSFVESLASLEARAVVIVDETQSLPPDALEQVRTLAEAADASSHLQVVLVGRPGLTELLKKPENRVLQQRVAVRATLDPLPAGEIGEYIQHRLGVAGGSRPQFDEAAVARIHLLSHGLPRVVNLLCDRALTHGFSVSTAVIDAAIVDAAADDLDLGAPASRAQRIGTRVVVALWILACLAAGSALAAWVFHEAFARALTRK